MSYFRHGLGADAAPQSCPPGFVWAEGQCALAPAPGVPDEMVGRAPGPMIWVPPAGTAAGYWRRARAGETGVLPTGLKAVIHGPDATQVLTEQGGKMVLTDVKLAPDLAACVGAGVPPALIDTCRQEAKSGASWLIWWKECARTGMPVELVQGCVEGRRAGQSLQQVVETLQQQAASGQLAVPPSAIPAPPGSLLGNRTLLLVGAAVGVGALFLFLRGRK